MGKIASMLEARLARGDVPPCHKRVFKAHDRTRSRVLMRNGQYSDPVEHSQLWQFLEANLDTISPEVPIAISRAEDKRRNP